MTEMKKMALRLALRHEAGFWNAYLALPGTMDNAKLIGSVIIGAVSDNAERKQQFMDLMQAVMADGIEHITGERPDQFEVESAPESERSGHG